MKMPQRGRGDTHQAQLTLWRHVLQCVTTVASCGT
jgi:hypothetical protein